MGKLLRGLLRTVVVLAGLLLLAWLLVLLLRWRAFGDDQQAAVALMEQPVPVPAGRSGFAALMLAGRDVAADEREALMAADVAAFATWLHGTPGEGPGFEPFAGLEAGERLPLPTQDAAWCRLDGVGCLAFARERGDEVRALLAAQAASLSAIDDALAAEHLSNPYANDITTPLPPFQLLRLPLTAAALDAAEGQVPRAMARSCGLLASARRFDRNASGLIEKLLTQTLAEGAASLLLELRREQPQTALPAECADALQPVATAEASVCAPMRGEYQMMSRAGIGYLHSQYGWSPPALAGSIYLFDAPLQAAWMAQPLAPYCGADAETLAAAGELPPTVAAERPQLDCLAAYGSCMLVEMAAPDYAGYAGRALDHAARLRLLLAAHAVADGRAEPAAAAAAAAVAGYPVAFDAATQTATLNLRENVRGQGTSYSVDFSGLAPVPAPADGSEPATAAPAAP